MRLWNDKSKALVVFAVIVITGLAFSQCAWGGDWRRPAEGWFPMGAVAYLGIDGDLAVGGGTNPFCRDGNHEVGRVGTRIPLWRDGRHTFAFGLDHQSCLQEEEDQASAEWAGVTYELQLW